MMIAVVNGVPGFLLLKNLGHIGDIKTICLKILNGC